MSAGYIYPQYHLVFDDLSETVMCQGNYYAAVDTICKMFLILIGIGIPKGSMIMTARNLVYVPPPLHEVWLDYQGSCDKICELEQKRRQIEDMINYRNHAITVPETITLNEKDNDLLPIEAPVYDDES